MRALSALFVLLPAVLAAIEPACPDNSQAEYDYVVVGAGAGGGPLAARLAENGFSVLVIDAGHDVHTVNTTVPFLFPRAVEDPELELSYTLDEYPPNFRYQKNDVWYPRSRGIGGSTLHNALFNIIASTRPEFDGLASMFNDRSFSRNNMQNYFKKLEHVLYPVLNADHGTRGWLKTNLNPVITFLNPKFLDLQITNFAASILSAGPPVLDLNSIAGDHAIGVNTPSFTVDEQYNRSSVRERLLDVQKASGRLDFILDTLATKVLLCNGTDGKLTAFGVEYAEGAALPVAGNFKGKGDLVTKNVFVKREVIVSAGAFQSPQLLMLSGIGDREQLATHGIDSAVHLPGVGKNLQDHDEIAVIWRMKQNFSLFDGCTGGPTREQDPCLKYWADVSKLHPYSFGGAFGVLTAKSRPSYTEPDMLTYFSPAYFPGFVRGFSQKIVDTPNAVTAISLKARPSSRGTVRLTGSHPQDLLDIQKQHFQAENGPRDVEDLREAIKRSREVMGSLPVALHVDQEIFPGPQARTDEKIEEHIYKNIFGHHACCTNAMGQEADPDAVLDGNFQVRGVNNLRVVDASSWPIVPGYFVTTPFYMLSEKAADVIMAKASL